MSRILSLRLIHAMHALTSIYLVQNIAIFEKSDKGTFGVKFGFWYEKVFVPIFSI